jgi:hypothetical protein
MPSASDWRGDHLYCCACALGGLGKEGTSDFDSGQWYVHFAIENERRGAFESYGVRSATSKLREQTDLLLLYWI